MVLCTYLHYVLYYSYCFDDEVYKRLFCYLLLFLIYNSKKEIYENFTNMLTLLQDLETRKETKLQNF